MERDVDQLKKIYQFCDEDSKLCRKLQQSLKLRNRKRLKSESGRSENANLKRGLKIMDTAGKQELFKEWLEVAGLQNCPFGSIKQMKDDFENGSLSICPKRKLEDRDNEDDESIDSSDFEF